MIKYSSLLFAGYTMMVALSAEDKKKQLIITLCITMAPLLLQTEDRKLHLSILKSVF